MKRYELLKKLIEENGYKKIAEVGVWQGETTSYLVENCSGITDYYAIDADLLLSYFEGVRLINGDSTETASQFNDGYFDLVFIDADHSCN